MNSKEIFLYICTILSAIYVVNYRSPEEYELEQLEIEKLELEIQYKRIELLNKRIQYNNNEINLDSITK